MGGAGGEKIAVTELVRISYGLGTDIVGIKDEFGGDSC